mmetsp:Transcript_19849/g.79101  ORF Transcript_19849/g.79101 Transcript_19849/m.79101 type:complete len:220 (-) Transcript_19849:1018-1677(-)
MAQRLDPRARDQRGARVGRHLHHRHGLAPQGRLAARRSPIAVVRRLDAQRRHHRAPPRHGLPPRTLLDGHPCRRRGHAQATRAPRVRRARDPPVPQGRPREPPPALDRRRHRHRAPPHAPAPDGPHRRGPRGSLARGAPRPSEEGRHRPHPRPPAPRVMSPRSGRRPEVPLGAAVGIWSPHHVRVSTPFLRFLLECGHLGFSASCDDHHPRVFSPPPRL